MNSEKIKFIDEKTKTTLQCKWQPETSVQICLMFNNVEYGSNQGDFVDCH